MWRLLAITVIVLCSGCSGPDPAALHDASRNGDATAVADLIRRGVDVNAVSEKGRTALHLAAREGHLAVVQQLLTAGATIDLSATNLSSDVGMTPLHLASLFGHRECAAALIEAGASLTSDNESDRSALMWAAVGGHVEIVSDLAEAGADPNEGNEWGQTALHLSSDPACSSRLVDLGADIEARTWRGRTPIMIAVGNLHPPVVTRLIEIGADVNARDDGGHTALHTAASWDARAEPRQVEAMIVALLDAGVEIDAQDDNGNTPLMAAADSGLLRAVELLVERGARLDLRNGSGRTAAEVAASRHSYEPGLKEFFDDVSPAGARPDGKEDEVEANPDNVPDQLVQFLPIVQKWGAINSDTERYDSLDKAEADPTALDELEAFNNAWTPEIGELFAEWSDREPMTENDTVARFYFTLLLLDELGFKLPRDEDADPVEELIEQLARTGSPAKDSGRMWAARGLPDYGEDAKRAIPHLESALDDPLPNVRIWTHYALARLAGDEARHREAIRKIGKQENNEDTDLDVESALENLDRSPEQHNIEALGSFCITNEVKQIRRLAPMTDVDGIDHNGQRPMLYAVGNGNPEAVRILLEHGADPNLRERSGETYLHTAATWRDNAEIIKALVEHGADLNAKDREGRTPLDVALEYRRKGNAELLRTLGAARGSR